MEVEEFLEHHGIKGMKWGVRKATFRQGFKTGIKPLTVVAKASGKLAVKGAIKGTKGAAKFSWNHPRTAAVIAAGSLVAVHIAKKKADQKVSDIQNSDQVRSGKARLDKLVNNGYVDLSMRVEKIK